MSRARDRNAKGTGGRFFIDNVFFRGNWARVVGPYGIAVYNVLALHADAITQTCWPSYETIAELAGMSRRQAMTAIGQLAIRRIIHIGKKGRSNLYTLLHPDEWGTVLPVQAVPYSPGQAVPVD